MVERYTAENKKGNIKILEGGAVKSFTVVAGFLNKKEAFEKEKYINNLLI